MPYMVIWLNGETVLGANPFDDLSDAMRHAKEQFPIKASRIGVTRVEVIDENDKRHLVHGTAAGSDEAEKPRRQLKLFPGSTP